MAKLIINNVYSFLTGIPESLAKDLNKNLRFPIKNRHWHPLVAKRQWDGFVEFFKENTGRFLTGLLPEIQHMIKSYELPLEVQDNRSLVEFNFSEIKTDFLGSNVELRDYQADFVNKIIKHQRGIIPAPTSAGKSMMMVCLLKAMKEKTPTLVLANRIDLIEQNYDELVKYGVENVGRFYGTCKKPDWITCATIQSCDKLAPIFPKIKAIIVDEIHDMMTKDCKWLYTRCSNATLRMGMSATPFKDGGKDLVQKYEVKGHIGSLLKTKYSETGLITTKELQKRDILSAAKCWFLPIDKPELKYVLYNEAVQLGISENEYFQDLIVDVCKKLKGRTIILVERVKQGDILAKMLGEDVAWVSGKNNRKTRKQVIEKLKFAKGNCIAIATRHIFNTGVNFFAHNLLNAAGGSAVHLIIQRFGRGLRKAKDKRILNYIDFYFKNNEYLEDHSKDRVKVLEKEGHSVTVFDHVDLEKLPWSE